MRPTHGSRPGAGPLRRAFDGEVDGRALDGDVTTFTLGADVAWSRWLAHGGLP